MRRSFCNSALRLLSFSPPGSLKYCVSKSKGLSWIQSFLKTSNERRMVTMGWKKNEQSYFSVNLLITILTVIGLLSWWTPASAQAKAGVIKARYSGWAPRRVSWGRLKNASLSLLHQKCGTDCRWSSFKEGPSISTRKYRCL